LGFSPSQVEDASDSSLAAILKVQFPPVYAEQEVEVAAEQFFARRHEAPGFLHGNRERAERSQG
jgi:hypothetical protein